MPIDHSDPLQANILPSIDVLEPARKTYQDILEADKLINSGAEKPSVVKELFNYSEFSDRQKRMERYVNLLRAIILLDFPDRGFIENLCAEKIAFNLWRLDEIEEQFPMLFSFSGLDPDICDVAIGVESIIYSIILQTANLCEVLTYHANQKTKVRLELYKSKSREKMDTLQFVRPNKRRAASISPPKSTKNKKVLRIRDYSSL